MKKWILVFSLMFSHAIFAQESEVKPLDLSENELGYFVSFSIPEKQLVALMKAAEKRNIPIYLNGLVNNTVEDTAKVMMYLTQKYELQGVLIDPVRFNYYGIKSVPALVKKCGANFDVVFGNLNLEQSLALIKSEGDCQ